MFALFHQILHVFATATTSRRELIRQIQDLKVENSVLRGKLPKRVTVNSAERVQLVRYARKVGSAIRSLVTIVSPGTLLRWIREDGKQRRTLIKRGRPRTPEQIRRLVLKLARENDWGYPRILGELKKLGITSLSKNTVKRILKANGLEPSPKRTRDSWDAFLKQHAESLWQCDFLSRKVMTVTGMRDVFVMVFIHVKTRQVVVTPATRKPNDVWMMEQIERVVLQARQRGLRVRTVMRDRDSKFTARYQEWLGQMRLVDRPVMYRSPYQNAYVERVIQTIQQECLDHFVIFGERHLDFLIREFLAHYHQCRPHQSLGNEVIRRQSRKRRKYSTNDEPLSLRDVRCEQRLGGLLKSYSRKAA